MENGKKRFKRSCEGSAVVFSFKIIRKVLRVYAREESFSFVFVIDFFSSLNLRPRKMVIRIGNYVLFWISVDLTNDCARITEENARISLTNEL